MNDAATASERVSACFFVEDTVIVLRGERVGTLDFVVDALTEQSASRGNTATRPEADTVRSVFVVGDDCNEDSAIVRTSESSGIEAVTRPSDADVPSIGTSQRYTNRSASATDKNLEEESQRRVLTGDACPVKEASFRGFERTSREESELASIDNNWME